MAMAKSVPALLALRFVPHALAPSPAALKAGVPPFRFFTWNHLAEGLDVHGDFTVDPAVLPWAFRGPRIAEILAAANADIVSLQEVSNPALVARALPGYSLFYAPKPESPALAKGGPPDGTALLVRTARFDVSSAETLHFSSAGETAISNQVALLAELRDKAAGGRPLIVCAAHLKAKAGAANDAVRDSQVRQLLAAATRLEAGRAGVPVILGGDFNSSPTAGTAYAAVLQCPSLRLASAYNRLPHPDEGAAVAATDAAAVPAAYASGEPAFTTWKFRGAEAKEKKEAIDYIWYGQGRGEGRPPVLGRLATLELPGEADIGPGALPAAEWPSDHLALGADFAWLLA